jgi:hypothetical protein
MGREDDPGRTSEPLFLADRASRGLRVKSVSFLYLQMPPALALVGPLAPSRRIPRGGGKGSRSSHPDLLPEALSA